MKKAILHRFETSDEGTFGDIIFGSHAFFTGEQPWMDNTANRSCIPEGEYICEWTFSPKYQRKMYLVKSVDKRSGIRIHPANLMGNRKAGFKSHLNGCIALGKRLGHDGKQKALVISRPAVTALENFMAGEDFELEIINGFS